MKLLQLFNHIPFLCWLLVFCSTKSYTQTNKATSNTEFLIDFEKIKDEKNTVNYTLDEIVTIIEDSIRIKNEVILPPNLTEFERALFEARKTQHINHQFDAIKQFKILLEFECYRTRGEELYIRLLLGTSLSYLGAPLIAHNYIKPVFPDIFNEIQNKEVSEFLISHYATLLVQIDSLEVAKTIYEAGLKQNLMNSNVNSAYKTRNNLGFVFLKLGQLEKAKQLFKENQRPEFKNDNPVLYAFAFGNYGSVLIKQEKYDSALVYLRKEIHLLQSFNKTEGLENALLSLGALYIKQNEPDSAEFYYTLALEQSTITNNMQTIVIAHKRLLTLYIDKTQKPELSSFLSNYLAYSDSLKIAQNSKAAVEELNVSKLLEIFNETEESRKRFDQLKGRNNELLVAITSLVILIIFLTIAISIRYRNRKRLKVKNIELKDKNKELQHSYKTISDSNAKNQILLKELHHRVKNNLQIISSLFNLQLNASEMDVQTESVFKDAQNRIHSISLVHKKIYQSDNVDSLDFEEYLRDFSDELLNATPNDVSLSIEILRNPISIDSAIPLGLIFNELFTNSIKHAKRHDSLQITVTHQEKNGSEKFIYTDNGVGVQNTEIMKESGSSIGVTLIHLLGKQLEANIEYKEAREGEHGFWLSIEGNFN